MSNTCSFHIELLIKLFRFDKQKCKFEAILSADTNVKVPLIHGSQLIPFGNQGMPQLSDHSTLCAGYFHTTLKIR